MADVSLSRLTHDIVQNSYKEMHALLDSLGDLAPEARRTKLLDFTLKMRHRFARLLVAVRWFMSYSAFHGSAQVTKQLASTRSGVLTQNADTLWMVSNVTKGAAAQASAVQEAAEVFGASAFFARIPRIIETSIGLDVSAEVNKLSDSEEGAFASETDLTSEAIERLGVATRYVVQSSLPSGVVVINTGVEPDNAAIRIGVPGAWTADLILDRLKLDEAFVVLLRYNILVGAHPDAPGSLHTRWRTQDTPVILSRQQSDGLRQMIEDRMRWETADATSAGDKANRWRKALLCLSQIMNYECAGKIAMEHIRSQSLALISHRVWKAAGLVLSGVGSQAADDVAVQIQYWQKSHMKGVVSVFMRAEENFLSWDGNILRVAHDGLFRKKELPFSIEVKSIHVEGLIMDTCRVRAVNELEQLNQCCITEFPVGVTAIVASASRSSPSLTINFDGHGQGLSFGFSVLTGGFFVRAHGAITLALSGTDSSADDLRRGLWKGDRFFPKGLLSIRSATTDLIRKAHSLLCCHTAMQNSCAIDAGAIPKWPPGVASVEEPSKTTGGKRVLPPLMPLDRTRPRRFLTLLSVADEDDEIWFPPGCSSSKRARSLPMHFSVSSEGMAFIEGRRPEGIELPSWSTSPRSSAVRMADWAEIHHAANLRMRRDNLLRELEEARLVTVVTGDYSLRSPHYSLLNLKASPLEIERAALSLFGNEGWRIQLTLTNDIFDRDDLRGQVVSYSSSKRLLTFSYSIASWATLRSFKRDFARARTSAALIQGLSSESEHYKIRRRTPSCVEVESGGLNFTFGTGMFGLQVEATPHNPVVSNHLIPLMEELMQASGKEMGYTLSELLELSLPVALALHAASPPDHISVRVRFSSALRARLQCSKTRHQTYALDVDVRGGFNDVIVMDVHRALLVANKSDFAKQFKPLPLWDALLQKLISKNLGKSIHSGAAVKIRLPNLKNILFAVMSGVSK